MLVDDRLETVLRQRVTGVEGQATQFRQLLDLLGAASGDTVRDAVRDPSVIAAALDRMSALADHIPADDRIAMIREPGWLLRNPGLVAHLADSEIEVAAAAIERARLSDHEWEALIERLPAHARGLLRLRADLSPSVLAMLDRIDGGAVAAAAPMADEPVPAPHAASPPLDPEAQARSEISALIDRIAEFRRDRDRAPPSADTHGPVDVEADDEYAEEPMPRLPLGEDDADPSRPMVNFGFTADAAGRIDWAEGPAAPMVVGVKLGIRRSADGRNLRSAIRRSLDRHQRIDNAAITLEGAPAIAGEWIVDAAPRFDASGNYIGHLGRIRRSASDGDPAEAPARQEADRIRQLLHELRTPVTAVQGYAEVIQQQLFGPAPPVYRALAGAIASDGARILAGFEELDRLARLELGTLEIQSGPCDLLPVVRSTLARIAPHLAARSAGIAIEDAANGRDGADGTGVAIDPDQAAMLVWRLLATLAAACAEQEMLNVAFDTDNGEAALTCDLPRQLAASDDIFAAGIAPDAGTIHAGSFGSGFALRLARAEARAAGGMLERDGDTMVLTLPLALAEERCDQVAL